MSRDWDGWTVGDLRDALADLDRETPILLSLMATRLPVYVDSLTMGRKDDKDWLVIEVEVTQ